MTPSDLAPIMQDTNLRDRAARMSGALKVYADCRHYASVAVRNGDERSAHSHRADARAALHTFPELVAILEPENVPPEPVDASTVVES